MGGPRRFRTTPAVDIAFRGSIGYQSISYISVDRDDDFIIANLGVTYTYSQQISFDATGDTQRKVFFTEIRDGRFVALKMK